VNFSFDESMMFSLPELELQDKIYVHIYIYILIKVILKA